MLISVLISLVMSNSCVMAANIFYISATPSFSHSMWNQKLAKLLVDKNHKVTMMDAGRKTFNHTNFDYHYLQINFTIVPPDLELASRSTSSIVQMDACFRMRGALCEEILHLSQTKTFLEQYRVQKQPFDLIIIDGTMCESFLGFVKVFGSPPLIITTPSRIQAHLPQYAGLYDNPSYVPQVFSVFPQNMKFFERIENLYLYIRMYYNYHWRYINKQIELAKSYFKDDSIDVMEIAANCKITLMNTHTILDGVKPQLPNIPTIAGIHIEKPKPLQKDLQTFLDNAVNGVVYFSLGSNIKCESMRKDKIDMFIKVFKDIKTNVLWKCGMNVSNLPSNMKLEKWMEQNDVLAHPNVKVFITHGGLLSTQEGIHHGVPMMVLPFIIDQHFTSHNLERMGVAIRLIYADLTAELLHDSLTKLLTDRRYQERMREVSELFRDNPVPPKDLTTFWIEYVLRHPHTKLLQSPTQNMPLYQLIMLDVVALFTGSFITIYFVASYIIRVINQNKKKDKVN